MELNKLKNLNVIKKLLKHISINEIINDLANQSKLDLDYLELVSAIVLDKYKDNSLSAFTLSKIFKEISILYLNNPDQQIIDKVKDLIFYDQYSFLKSLKLLSIYLILNQDQEIIENIKKVKIKYNLSDEVSEFYIFISLFNIEYPQLNQLEISKPLSAAYDDYQRFLNEILEITLKADKLEVFLEISYNLGYTVSQTINMLLHSDNTKAKHVEKAIDFYKNKNNLSRVGISKQYMQKNTIDPNMIKAFLKAPLFRFHTYLNKYLYLTEYDDKAIEDLVLAVLDSYVNLAEKKMILRDLEEIIKEKGVITKKTISEIVLEKMMSKNKQKKKKMF